MPENHTEEFITKGASIAPNEVHDRDLELINRFTLRELTAEDVFTFAVVLCDNKTDRDYDRFTDKSLDDLKKLFVGRTIIKDHNRRADNQIARIYSTEITAPNGELDSYRQLKAKAYMVRTESNADLIREIEAGIKKEGSVSFRLKRYICGICGTDNVKTYCAHWPGVTYETKDGPRTCVFSMDGVKDAFEFSLVAVPAQPAAGACKSYKEYLGASPAEPAEENKSDDTASLRARLMEARIDLAASINRTNKTF